MKRTSAIFMIILLTISSCTMRENSNNQGNSTGSTLNKQVIQKAVEEFNQAMINSDSKILDALCSNELSYGHSSGLIQNKSEFIDDLINGPYDFISISSPDLSISISKNIGIARFIFLAKALKDGQEIHIRIGCIQVFQKQNNELKMLARQAFKLPESISKN